jgi:mono/diheme cytochrome c family protein
VKQAPLAIFLTSATFALVLASGTSSLTALALRAQAGDKPAAAPSYTEEQSTRGEALYTKSCGFCHADPSMAPALQGDVFLKNWSDQTAAALFDKIQQTMPANEPGTLTAPQSADLVAYILKLNHFPAGQTALPTETAALGALKLSPK